MARYQIILSYDGTDFFGFQRQGRERTVQLVLEEALSRLGWRTGATLAAGRTDTGVHGSGQVMAFDLAWQHSDDELLRALNANLPLDVAVRSVKQVAADFHPRYNALQRSYQYKVYCQPYRDPLKDRFAWRVWPEVDLAKAQAGARLFEGQRDFSLFGKATRPGGSTIRKIVRAEWEFADGFLRFDISADAFLYHMVRRIVFILVRVGQDEISLSELQESINTGIHLIPGLAPPQGLILVDVKYEAL